tara:strand:+ start:318 stop:1910 length:1593 start_codon:yes stop_codon:yes gene_type:complete
MRRIVLLIIGCLFFQTLTAQIISSEAKHRERLILSEVLLFLDDYENDVIWKGAYNEGLFASLFTSNASVLNDIPMANSQEQVTVQSYIKDALKFIRSPARVKIYPYSIILTQSYKSNTESDRGSIVIDVKKKIRFRSPNTFNDEMVNYEDILDQKFHIEYNYDDLSGFVFRIQRIESNVEKGSYVIISYSAEGTDKESLDNYFGDVIVESIGEQLKSKSETFGVFTLNDFSESRDFKIFSNNSIYFQKQKVSSGFKSSPGQDIREDSRNSLELKFRKRRLSLIPEVGFDFMNSTIQQSAFNSQVNFQMQSLDYSLGVGMRILSKPNGSVTLNLRAGSSKTTNKLSSTPFTMSSIQIDDANDSYKRILKVSQFSEIGSSNKTFFAGGISAEKRWGIYELCLFSDFIYHLSGDYNYNTTVASQYSGLYGPEYFNIEITDLDYYGFGSFNLSLDDMTVLREELTTRAGLAILQDINKRTQIKLSFGYVLAVKSPFNTESNLSFDEFEYQSILEISPELWTSRFRTSFSILYYL